MSMNIYFTRYVAAHQRAVGRCYSLRWWLEIFATFEKREWLGVASMAHARSSVWRKLIRWSCDRLNRQAMTMTSFDFLIPSFLNNKRVYIWEKRGRETLSLHADGEMACPPSPVSSASSLGVDSLLYITYMVFIRTWPTMAILICEKLTLLRLFI